MSASKTWAFTLNNWTEEEFQRIKDWEKRFLVVGKEVGKTGTPHLQGWVTFKRTMRLNKVRALLSRAHWEVGKCSDGMNYCMKDGDYYKEDNRRQGQRSDLLAACDLLKSHGKQVRGGARNTPTACGADNPPDTYPDLTLTLSLTARCARGEYALRRLWRSRCPS